MPSAEHAMPFCRRQHASRPRWLAETPRPGRAVGWVSVDPALRPIVHGAALPDDDDTALERVLSHLASRPPRTWTDADADRCVARAYSAGSQLLQAMAAMGISSVDRLDTEEQERSREITTYLRGLLPAGIPTRIMRAILVVRKWMVKGLPQMSSIDIDRRNRFATYSPYQGAKIARRWLSMRDRVRP